MALFASLLLHGCGEKGSSRPADVTPVATREPEDELALRVSDSVVVWYTGSRADTAADGTACRERVMEVRAGARTIPIPLLYTAEVPTIANDSTLQVHIWRHCAQSDLYRVHLRTGQPTRAGP